MDLYLITKGTKSKFLFLIIFFCCNVLEFHISLNLQRENKHVDDSWKRIPTDNCYVAKYYRWPVYTVAEAIECHREVHHPTMYNLPNSPIIVHIELNMKGEKATRFVDNFQRVAMMPHKFDHGEERRILVFTKGNVSSL